jgi:hypothetical protein
LPAAVVGRPETFDFLVIDLRDAAPMPDVDALSGRGFRWLGNIGLVNGRTRVALAESLDTTAMEWLAALYADLVRVALSAPTDHDDSIAWCERLYRLVDPRAN